MENLSGTKIAVVAIIVSDLDAVEKINALLHTYSEYVIGRMGVPYKQKGVNVIFINGVHNLVGFLDYKGAQGLVSLYGIPRTAEPRAKLIGNFDKVTAIVFEYVFKVYLGKIN